MIVRRIQPLPLVACTLLVCGGFARPAYAYDALEGLLETETETAATTEVAGAPAVDAPPESSIAELLAASELATDYFDDVTGRERWALHSLLALGPVQSLDARALVEKALAREQAVTRSDAWLDDFVHERAVAQLHRPTAPLVVATTGVSYDIPIASHELVTMWIDYFTGRGRWFFEKWLARSERYIPMMQPILEQHGLPKDLVYLAMIESGFSAKAYSIAAAAGFWQFIRSTGQQFGMRTDVFVDERRDFVIATHSAARYLKSLNKLFKGDWYLAWASYNAGSGRVQRALTKTGGRSFWDLVAAGALPRETQHYVPKIIAAAIVAKNREAYGFTNVTGETPLAYDEVEVDDAVDLKVLAKKLGVAADALRELNPMFLYDLTPPKRKSLVRVPPSRGEEATTALASMPRVERLAYLPYRVQKGDTLSGIAKRHGTTVAMIQEFNTVKSPKALRLGQQLIIPGVRVGMVKDDPVVTNQGRVRETRASAVASAAKGAAPARTKVEAPAGKEAQRHVVAAGDTLWSISQRYGTTTQELKRWNAKRTSKLMIGETLTVYR